MEYTHERKIAIPEEVKRTSATNPFANSLERCQIIIENIIYLTRDGKIQWKQDMPWPQWPNIVTYANYLGYIITISAIGFSSIKRGEWININLGFKVYNVYTEKLEALGLIGLDRFPNELKELVMAIKNSLREDRPDTKLPLDKVRDILNLR